MKRSDVALSCAIFCAVLASLAVIDGNRLHLGILDEGIYLDGAERMRHGERLYSDFFGYMSPGMFWLQEFFFRVLGITMFAGRLPVLMCFAAECASLFWLTARLASRSIAWSALLLFLALQTTKLNFLTAQHYWVSVAIVLASMALAVHGLISEVRWTWGLAGAFGALAAIFTPSMLLISGLTLVWLVALRGRRLAAVWYSAGAAAAGATILVVMIHSGMLWPFVEQMRWLSQNYSASNRLPYGAPDGGYRALLAGPVDATMPGRVLGTLIFCLPAILPVTNLAGWAAVLAFRNPATLDAPRKRAILYLLSCSVALVVATWPRPGLTHLALIAPVPFVLAGALLSLAPPKPMRESALVLALLGGALTALHLAGSLGSVAISTPVGTVRAPEDSAASVRALLDSVKPGDTAFVHPYLPLLYFLTQTKNPTRFSYLQPGLMTDADERSALRDLQRSPPHWVMLLRLSPEQFLSVFPSGDLARLRFRAIENWIDSHYTPVNPSIEVAGYSLLCLRRDRGTP